MSSSTGVEKGGYGEGFRDNTAGFEKILEMGDDGILVMEGTGKVAYVNSVVSSITGFSEEELYRGGLKNFMSTDALEVLKEMEQGSRGVENKKVCTEMQITDRSGVVKACEVCIASDAAGHHQRFYLYMRDITGRKEMEAQVRASEEKYRRLFDATRHGIFVSSKEGKFLDCNQAVLSMLGYDNKEEFLALDLATNVYESPEDRKKFQEIVEREGYVKDYEVTYKTKAGEVINVLLTCETMADEAGAVMGYRGMMMDVTRRKKVEKDLRETNRFLNMLIEASPDGIIVTDAKGDIIMYNKAAERILGYTNEDVIGRANVKSLYPKGLARRIRELLMDDRVGGKGVLPPTELFVKNKWGEIIDISLSASLLFSEKGDELAAIGIFKDLGEMVRMKKKLRETEEQLFQAERLAAMGRLTSRIAHEINNPLYGIINTLELLKTEIAPTSKRRELLDMSLSEVVRLSTMVKNMLTFSRPDQETRKEIDMNKSLEGILMFLERQLQECDIRLSVDLDRDLPLVTVSAGQMRQVFLNLIKNGMEAMPHGGDLTVATRVRDKTAEIVIQDTGVGMTKEVKERIFDAFFTTKEHDVKGVGLGLSVCYGIVKDHGGEIKVESDPGKGSSFAVCLPVSGTQLG
ncbi:MAG: PAS domain S-box protein [Syntrophorhabdales bacterium]